MFPLTPANHLLREKRLLAPRQVKHFNCFALFTKQFRIKAVDLDPDTDPHSFSLLDADPYPHSIWGSGRGKFEEKPKKNIKIEENCNFFIIKY